MKLQIEINENVDFIIVFRKINDASQEAKPEVTSIKETTVESDENPMNFTDTAKLLGVKRKDMLALLESQGYICRDDERKPYALDKYVKQGLFQNIPYHCRNGHHGMHTRITKKGIAFIAELLQVEKLK